MRCKIGDVVMVVGDPDNSGRFGTVVQPSLIYGPDVWRVKPQHTFKGRNFFQTEISESADLCSFYDSDLIPIRPDLLKDEEDMFSEKPLSHENNNVTELENA